MLELILVFAGIIIPATLLRRVAEKKINDNPPRNVVITQLSTSQVAYLCGGSKHLYPTWWYALRQRGAIQKLGHDKYTMIVPQDKEEDINRVAYLHSIQPANLNEEERIRMACNAREKEVLQDCQDMGLISSYSLSGFLSKCWAASMVLFFFGLVSWINSGGFQATGFSSAIPYLLLGGCLGFAFSALSIAAEGNSVVNGFALTNTGKSLREKIKSRYSAAVRAPTQDTVLIALAVGGTTALIGTPFEAMGMEPFVWVQHPARPDGSSSTSGDGSGVYLYADGTPVSDTGASSDVVASSFSSGGFMSSSGFSTGSDSSSGSDSGSGGGDGGSGGDGGGSSGGDGGGSGCGGCGG